MDKQNNVYICIRMYIRTYVNSAIHCSGLAPDELRTFIRMHIHLQPHTLIWFCTVLPADYRVLLREGGVH